MRAAGLTTSYQLIGELLLNPSERDPVLVKKLHRLVEDENKDVERWITTFLATAGSTSRDEYVQTLELSPPCPLYLGAHLFDEPTTCNGVGTSGRNVYMLELAGIYGHFGFDITGRELPDYLPAMVDFLWISLENQDRDGIGLRRRFVEHYVSIGLEPLKIAMQKYKSPYALLVSALQSAVDQDVSRMADDAPAWKPAEEASGARVSLPVLSNTLGGYADSINGYEAVGRSTPGEFGPSACDTGEGTRLQGSK